MAKSKQPSRTMQFYKSYSFKDKDPVIDVVRTAFEDSGETYASLHEKTSVSTTTMRNWFNGKTIMPRMATIAAFGSGLGYTAYDWEKRRLVGGRPRLAVVNSKEKSTMKKGA